MSCAYIVSVLSPVGISIVCSTSFLPLVCICISSSLFHLYVTFDNALSCIILIVISVSDPSSTCIVGFVFDVFSCALF